MANITEDTIWRPNIYEWAITDPIKGGTPTLDTGGDPIGTNGLDNVPTKQLADRTQALRAWHRQIRGAATGKKNVVVDCVRTSAGIDNYMTLTPGSPNNVLSFTLTKPLVIAFSNGFDENGPREYYGYVTSQANINLAASAAYFIIADYNVTTGAVTITGSTDFDPSNGFWAGYVPRSTVNGAYWFDLGSNKMFHRESGAWVEKIRVILGFADTTPGSESVNYYSSETQIGAVYGNDTIPAGMTSLFGTSLPPTGWIFCDGSAVSRSIYPRLFAVVGTTYGAGDGSTTFNVPNFAAIPDASSHNLYYMIKI